jgi:hypothetical protein
MDEKFVYETLKKENPGESEPRLRAAAKEIAETYKPFGPIEGRVGVEAGLSSGALAKAIIERGKAFFKKSAQESTKKSRKKPTKKQVLLGGAALGVTGLAAQGLGGDDDSVETDVVNRANTDLMLQLAQYEVEGGDPAALAATTVGQQLFKDPNFNLGALINSGNISLQGQGVYTGKPTGSGFGVEKKGSKFPTNFGQPSGYLSSQQQTDSISLRDWNNQFPIADPKGLAEWKSKLVSAGVVSASAGLAELQKQWSAWGEFSQSANKAGQKLTPDQLLDIQRGLWGGGDGGRDYSTQYSVQMLKPENVKSMYKAAREQGAGAIIGDEDAAAFAERIAAQQMAKPSKTEFKKIKGKMVPVTTPGFGEAETAAAAVASAKKDPLYAEFQTANVFGSALERALGVRP